MTLLGTGTACAPAPLRVPAPEGGPAPGPADAAAPADGAALPVEMELPRCFPKSTPSGVNVPGDFCTAPEQCKHAPDDIAICAARDEGEEHAKLARCHLYTRAILGQPCIATLTGNGQLEGGTSPLGGGPLPDTSGYCHLRDGLVCDGRDHQCRPVPKLGESCATRPYCPRGSFCDAGTCTPGRPVGGHCQGVLDFTEQAQCATGAHCDIVTDTCVPAAAEGEKCDYGPQCTSGVCFGGTCAPPWVCPL